MALVSSIHWKEEWYTFRLIQPYGLVCSCRNHTCLGSDDLGVLIPTKKSSTCSVVKLRYPLQFTANRFQRRTTSIVFSNDEWCEVSHVGFDNARSGPWGHLRPVRKYACLSMSFMISATSLKSNIRNADSVFGVSVCFRFEPPNKLNFSYGAGALQSFTWFTPCVCQWIPVTGNMR